jgi:nucleoside-diphosphate-sugar epimerase
MELAMKIFLAGATGVIGRSLVPLLRDAGHVVTGTSRSAEGKARLEALGIQGVVVDVFDREALEHAVAEAVPDVVFHQLTDLAGRTDPQSLERNARLRREGTPNLAHAARAAGAKRLIAQSIAWAYAPKQPPYRETDPLDVGAEGLRGVSVRDGVVPLETAVLRQSGFDGVVLRYGRLYGPGTWSPEPSGRAPVHVEAAAYAAFLALDHGAPGAYNIAEPDGEVATDNAIVEFGWRSDFRLKPQKQ